MPELRPLPPGSDSTSYAPHHILVAQPLACEYAEVFKGLEDDGLGGLAGSFAFSWRAVRE